MKKKILSLCLCVSMLALLIVGGTLAYFTDTDTADNIMTAGNVEIDMHESNNKWTPADGDYDYENNPDGTPADVDGDYDAWLADQPFVPMQQIEKDVWVENTGSQPLYTRVHIAVPEGAYDSAKTADENIVYLELVTAQDGWVLGDDTYSVEIDGYDYDVIVLTYAQAVEAGEQTPICLSYVSMNKDVKCSNLITDPADDTNKYVEYTLGTSKAVAKDGLVHVKVFVEAGQQFGFTEAAAALNAQFGNPADAGYVSPFAN